MKGLRKTPKHEIYTPACASPTSYRHFSIDLTDPLQKSCWSNKPIPTFMKGNISATQVAFFGNVSTHPELELCAEPADGFHKAPCSCTNKTKPTSLPRVASLRRNSQVWDFHMPKLITFSIHMDSWEVWDYLMSDYSTLCQHFYAEYKNSLHFLWTTWTSKVTMCKHSLYLNVSTHHFLPTLVLMKNGPSNSQKMSLDKDSKKKSTNQPKKP